MIWGDVATFPSLFAISVGAEELDFRRNVFFGKRYCELEKLILRRSVFFSGLPFGDLLLGGVGFGSQFLGGLLRARRDFCLWVNAGEETVRSNSTCALRPGQKNIYKGELYIPTGAGHSLLYTLVHHFINPLRSKVSTRNRSESRIVLPLGSLQPCF